MHGVLMWRISDQSDLRIRAKSHRMLINLLEMGNGPVLDSNSLYMKQYLYLGWCLNILS
ncbi:hypothetical protein D3C76_1011110 [compost metagenome]